MVRAGRSGRDGSRQCPFEDVATRPHPTLQLLEDIIGGEFALLRLTHAELSRRTAPPPDSRLPGEHAAEDEGSNAWELAEPESPIWLVERDDPNAGKAPVDAWTEGGDYLQPLDPGHAQMDLESGVFDWAR